MLVRLKIQPGKEAEAEEAARTIAAAVKDSEPGVVVYQFFRSLSDPSEMIITEGYADQAAFDEHMKQPHVLQFMARMPQIFDMSSVSAGNLNRVAGFTRDS
jgi:quinol monooxygenase YgiN